MKIIVTLLFTFCIAFNGIAQEHDDHEKQEEEKFEHHCKFEERSLILGIGGAYSTSIDQLGLNLRMYYNINEHFCFGPEYSYFRNDEHEIVDFDFVGYYIFETHLVGIYPLFGGNYTVETTFLEDIDEENEIEEEFGVIYGLGIHPNVKGFTFFAEYSRIDLGIDDQFITAGVMYMFR